MVGGQHEQGAALDVGVCVRDGEHVGSGVDRGERCAFLVAGDGPDEGRAVVADYIAAIEGLVQEVVEGAAGLGVIIEVGGREEVGDMDNEFFWNGLKMRFGGLAHNVWRIWWEKGDAILSIFFPPGEIGGKKSVTWGWIKARSGLSVELDPYVMNHKSGGMREQEP